jgi:K+-sensing histidine kinase KdpD
MDLDAVLHSLGEGVSIADTSGTIIFSNRAADRILGVGTSGGPPDEWTDHYGVYLPDETTPFPVSGYPLVRALEGEETRDVEMFVRNAQLPEGVLIAVTGRPLLDAAGRVAGAAVVFRDITALRRAEDEIKAAVAALHETQRLKDELSTFLVHDFKGPLTSIMVSADLLQMAGGRAEDPESVEDIREGARMLHRMVLDLLDIQLAEDGGLKLTREDVSVAGLLNEVREATAPRAAASDQRMVMRAATDDFTVVADLDLMRRVLQNLVDNCVKYGPQGGTIWMDASRHGDGSVLLRVCDEGPGVPPDMRERIFEKYARFERDAATPRRDSRGLGLRFCRVVVEAHGGRVWVEDHEPRGACFCVELPAAVRS